MTSIYFVFLSVLIFAPFSSTFSQESTEAEQSGNTFIRNFILRSSAAFQGINPALISTLTRSLGLGPNSSEADKSGNSTSRNLTFGRSSDFHGIDPALLLLSLTFRRINISLECLRELNPLFGQYSLFPALRFNSFISINHYVASFPFDFPTQETLINFSHWVPVIQNSRHQLLQVLNLCNEAGDNNYSVLLFLYYLISTNSPEYLVQFPTIPSYSTKCANYEGILKPLYFNRKNFVIS